MHNAKKVLITDHVHSLLITELQKMGYECDYCPDFEPSRLMDVVSDYGGLVINSKITVQKEVIDRAPHLSFIARLGSGMEIIDVEYAKSKGISCINSPEGNRVAVAEHALGMLLMLFRHLSVANAEVKKNLWNREKNRGLELTGKVVAIIGYGNTGKSFAQILKGFDCTVMAYDKYLQHYSDEYVQEATLAEIYKKAEIVSLHLPLSKETTYWLNQERIDQFLHPIYIINTSRGKVVNTNDLIHSIESEKIQGACLDVFEQEKPSLYSSEERKTYNRLFSFQNVVCSPHIAGWTEESKRKMAQTLVDKIKDLSHISHKTSII